jgi:hypothetical protein
VASKVERGRDEPPSVTTEGDDPKPVDRRELQPADRIEPDANLSHGALQFHKIDTSFVMPDHRDGKE